jgi:hypothetical protein
VSGGTVSYLAVGSCVIDANQAGNAKYAAATQAQLTITVAVAALIGQTITFTAPAPATGTALGTATLSATGGGSGNPVTFSVDSSSVTVCSVSGGTVLYLTAGSCVIDANQAGSAKYAAAPQAQLTITVAVAALIGQPIMFTPPVPATGTAGGSAAVSATGGGSGNPVVFSVDSSSGSGVCSVSGGTVSSATVTFNKVGSCVIDANQAGSAKYAAATPDTLTITVSAAASPTASRATSRQLCLRSQPGAR